MQGLTTSVDHTSGPGSHPSGRLHRAVAPRSAAPDSRVLPAPGRAHM